MYTARIINPDNPTSAHGPQHQKEDSEDPYIRRRAPRARMAVHRESSRDTFIVHSIVLRAVYCIYTL